MVVTIVVVIAPFLRRTFGDGQGHDTEGKFVIKTNEASPGQRIDWKKGVCYIQLLSTSPFFVVMLDSHCLVSHIRHDMLQLWGQYYREVLEDPEGDSHQNIRNFMKYGWEGVPFENGIALTRKNSGDGDWDAFAESWIP